MKVAVLIITCSLAATNAFAQPPRVVNARMSARSAEPDLARAIAAIASQQAEPAWIGYAVPKFIREGAGQDNDNQDAWSERCRLEPTAVDGVASGAGSAAGPVHLEPSPTLLVLMRVQNREVQRIRTFPGDCAIDAGGLAVYWLDGVNAAQSVAHLKASVTNATSRGNSDGALSAMSLHRDPSAAIALLDLAKNNSDARVRERSLFWVARRAESQAIPAISEAIERDPDLQVKKQAVFALSRLPKDQGIPLLITLARSSGNPAVRKQAMFWLGQSRDARAIEFFEQVLRK